MTVMQFSSCTLTYLELYLQPGILYPLRHLECQVRRSVYLVTIVECAHSSAWCSGISRGERCFNIRSCNTVSYRIIHHASLLIFLVRAYAAEAICPKARPAHVRFECGWTVLMGTLQLCT